MAIKRLTIDGYGQVELNNVAFRRDGRIEAQCKLDATDFATGAENGMLVAVDKVNKKIIHADEDYPLGIIYSAEKLYNPLEGGLKNFKNELDGFLPRVGYIAVGDLFTTNCFEYDSAEFSTEVALKSALAAYATTAVYAGIGTTGAFDLSATAPTAGPVLKVVENTTMPDGQLGIKLQVMSI